MRIRRRIRAILPGLRESGCAFEIVTDRIAAIEKGLRLAEAGDTDRTYIDEILPAKMAWNLEDIRKFSFPREIRTMARTILAVFGKDYH